MKSMSEQYQEESPFAWLPDVNKSTLPLQLNPDRRDKTLSLPWRCRRAQIPKLRIPIAN